MSLASDIAALLADASTDKVFPAIAPQGTRPPYVVWRRNGGDPMATMGGTGTRTRPNIVVYSVAETFDEADALAEEVRTLLKAGSSTIKCHSVGLPIDGFDPDTKLQTVAIEAAIFHKP